MKIDNKLVIALDGTDEEAAVSLVKAIRSSAFARMILAYKVHVLWDLVGPKIVRILCEAGAPRVWADLKLHDTKDTVAKRAAAVAKAGASYLTVHAKGGIEMMRAAVAHGPAILAISELTSSTEEDVDLGSGHSAKASVLHLAQQAVLARVEQLVCSPQEVAMLRSRPELSDLILFTPGVRSPKADHQDQKRVGTFVSTFSDGANHAVVGREVVEATNPIAALENIARQIDAVP